MDEETGDGTTPEMREAIMRAASDLVGRMQFADAAGLTYWGPSGFKRDLYTQLGYPKNLTIREYRSRYERGGIAERIIEAFPRGTWARGTFVVEDQDPNVETKFEKACEELFDRLDVWKVLARADVLANIGRYSVVLLGAPGDLESKLPSLASEKALAFMVALGEDRATIHKFDEDPRSPRFGQPEMYELQLGVPAAGQNQGAATYGQTKKVHWTRVLHVAEGCLDDLVYGKPRLRAPWNYINDLEKLTGGGAEAAWKRMDPGMALKMDPTMKLDAGGEAALTREVDEYVHGLRRVMKLVGVDAQVLQAGVVNFGDNVRTVVELISGTTGIPQRILLGSERGELASSQDRDNWAERIAERRHTYAAPLVDALVERLIEHNALPKPKQHEVVWPDIEELSEKDKAQIASTLAAANSSQFTAEGKPILTSNEIRDTLYDLEPLEDLETHEEITSTPPGPVVSGQPGAEGKEGAEEVPAPPEAKGESEKPEEKPEQRAASALALAKHDARRRALKEQRARRMLKPERNAISLAGSRYVKRLGSTLLAFWLSAQTAVDARELEQAIEQGDRWQVQELVRDQISETALEELFLEFGIDAMFATGQAALNAARARNSWLRPGTKMPTAYQRLFNVSRLLPRTEPFEITPELMMRFDITNPRAVDVARDEAGYLAKELRRSTIDAVVEIVEDAFVKGKSPRVIARLIREIVGLRSDQVETLNRWIEEESPTEKQIAARTREMLQQRAELIARTEVNRVANAAQRELWMQAQDQGLLPKDAQRVWIATPDDRVREEHWAMNGQVVPIDGEFLKPDGTAIEPGEEPNCRCTQALASAEDIENAEA